MFDWIVVGLASCPLHSMPPAAAMRSGAGAIAAYRIPIARSIRSESRVKRGSVRSGSDWSECNEASRSARKRVVPARQYGARG
jgi:hypothetical protein